MFKEVCVSVTSKVFITGLFKGHVYNCPLREFCSAEIRWYDLLKADTLVAGKPGFQSYFHHLLYDLREVPRSP